MSDFRRHGRNPAESGESDAPTDTELRAAALVLERFDFEHPVFQEDTWSEVESSAESLPESVSVWVDQLRNLVARQVGTKEILAALDDTLLDREQEADRYVDDGLEDGKSREQIRAEVQAAHDALESRIHEITFPRSDRKTP